MKEQTTTANRENRPVWTITDTAEQLNLCKVIRYLDIRAIHQSNGTSPALEDLRIGCLTDELWSKTADRQQTADSLKTLAEAERHIADKARYTVFKAVRATEEDRQQALAILNEYSTLADNDNGEAQDIEKHNSTLTASLAQDMLHTIWLELQTITADTTRHTDKAFGELCKAGRQFITDFTAVSAIDSNNTTIRPLSTAEAVDIMTRYNINPLARPRQSWKQTVKGCTGYYTLEGKTRKKDIDPKKVNPAIIANYAHYNETCIWYYEHITITSTVSEPYTSIQLRTYRRKNNGKVEEYQLPTAEPGTPLDPEAIRQGFTDPQCRAKESFVVFWQAMTKAQKEALLGLDPADNPVLCLVCHTQTIRTKDSIDTLTDHDPRTAQAIIDSALADIDVIALAEQANLSLQARTALQAMTSPEAVQTAKQAYNASMENGKAQLAKLEADRAKAGKKPLRPGKVKQYKAQFQTTADNAYNSTLWEYGLTVAGYTAKAEAKRSISKALAKALAKAPDNVTPGAIDLERLMRQKPHGRTEASTAPRKDYIKAVSEAKTVTHIQHLPNGGTATTERKITAPAPVVKWTESGLTPEAITPQEALTEREREALARAEAMKAHGKDIARLEARRTLDTVNRWKFDSYTADQQYRIARKLAESKAKARAKARAKAKAIQNKGIYTLNSTFEMWKAWTEAERKAHLDFIRNFNR